jgi:hypothetical protein
MKAKIAYLTSPAPDRYVIKFQEEGSEELRDLEISEGHLANIIGDGAHYAFRKQCSSVPFTQTENEHERTEHRA